MAMNPEIKAKWVAALRSGEYKQGRDSLRKGDGFCCLGVLCDLYDSEHSSDSWQIDPAGDWMHVGEFGVPCRAVLSWAGLESANPKVTINKLTDGVAVHNDGTPEFAPRTFSEIADAIEAQL